MLTACDRMGIVCRHDFLGILEPNMMEEKKGLVDFLRTAVGCFRDLPRGHIISLAQHMQQVLLLNIMLGMSCAVLCCDVLCCAVLCCAVLCCAVLCCAVPCCAALRRAVLCCAVLCCAALRRAILYMLCVRCAEHAMLCSTCYAMPSCAYHQSMLLYGFKSILES